MRITTKGRYTLKAMLCLARHPVNSVLSVKQISEETSLSYEFLEQLLVKLKKAGLARSVRGPGGGYTMARPAQEISIKDIFDAVGETIDLTDCQSCKFSELVCVPEHGCESHLIWKGATEYLVDFFTKVSLDDVQNGRISVRI